MLTVKLENCKKTEAIEALQKVLVSDEMLFRFDVTKKANVTILTVEKETQQGEYSVYGENQFNKMMKFLEELKSALPTYLQDDVDIVIEELEDKFNYTSNY